MTLEEFDIEFEMLFNNISSNKAPGLTPLEKSVFLTQAQDIILMDAYRRFEQSEEMAEYLHTHVEQKDYFNPSSTSTKHLINSSRLRSSIYDRPDDMLEILTESAEMAGNGRCPSIGEVPVIPTTHDEFFKVYKNPFRGAGQYRALRLLSQDKIEIFSPYNIVKYTVRYLKKPEPIVLKDVGESFEPYSNYPNGYDCKLPVSIHRTILLKAVELAKTAWS